MPLVHLLWAVRPKEKLVLHHFLSKSPTEIPALCAGATVGLWNRRPRLSAGHILTIFAMVAGVVVFPVPVAQAAVGTGDVFGILTRGGSGRTEVHGLSRALGYRSFSIQSATASGPTDLSVWSFGIGDYDGNGTADFVAVNTRDNGGANTAAHVFSGESSYRTALLHRRLPGMGSASLTQWQFTTGDHNVDGRADLVAINTRDSGTNSTAVHVLDAAGGYNSYIAHSGSALHPTDTTARQFHGWAPARRPAPPGVPPNPYPAETVTHGWTRRMQYVVHHLTATFNPRSCGGRRTAATADTYPAAITAPGTRRTASPPPPGSSPPAPTSSSGTPWPPGRSTTARR